VVPPPPEPGPVPAANFTGLLGGDGEITDDGHAPVLAGLPQVGYGNRRLPGFHWANDARWLIHANDLDDYGFRDDDDGHVVVTIRSNEQDATMAWEQNDGWFRFKVRVDSAAHDEIRFMLNLETSHGVNHWFDGTNASWDWVVYRAMYRVLSPVGAPGPWRRTGAPVVEGGLESRTPRGLFTIDLTKLPEHGTLASYHVEVAQGLPYTLEDRAAFFESPTPTLPPGIKVTKLQLSLAPDWDPVYGGLSRLPGTQKEENELYAIALYKEPNTPSDVIVVTAGVHYEPPSMFVLEGLKAEIIANPGVLDDVSFVLYPAANPDAWEWACAHVRPWGDGVGDLENGGQWAQPWQEDPEAEIIRNHIQYMIDVEGVSILAHIDLHADLAPHPMRWAGLEIGEPPTYAYAWSNSAAADAAIAAVGASLRTRPYSKPYIRPVEDWPSYQETPRPHGSRHWELPQFHVDHGIPAMIVMEYDETALYRAYADPEPQPGLEGIPTQLLGLLREPQGPHPDEDKYWVDGYIDDPVVYRHWGPELFHALVAGFVQGP
ncbi:MAG: M14 family metallopeptidase, partial [Planctomycetota bacterium]